MEKPNKSENRAGSIFEEDHEGYKYASEVTLERDEALKTTELFVDDYLMEITLARLKGNKSLSCSKNYPSRR